jgi:hypothetical protein
VILSRHGRGEGGNGGHGREVNRGRGWRDARRRPRQPDDQGTWPGGKDERRVHHQRLAIDPDFDRCARVNLELGGFPLQPALESPYLTGRFERDEPPGFVGPADPGGDQAEGARIDPLAGPPAPDMIQLVRVVRDEDQVRGGVLGRVRPGKPQVQRLCLRPE